jgi:beta-galactosidase
MTNDASFLNSVIRYAGLLLAVMFLGPIGRANDGIFPPAPAAAAAINFDGKGFIIRGQREFIASGTIHFPRVPRELWRDRLLKLKRAGCNTVQTYVFWNFQETREGVFDFTTDEHDLGAFLQTAQDVGLYATVRVGPYVCAEWDSGGYPVWLRWKPGLLVRNDNPVFIGALDKYYNQLLPIVAAHQINRGGNVILVQLENEDPEGWGTSRPNSYFTYLQKKALDEGIEVPYFFSGLHHNTDSAGTKPWDSAKRTNPWYSTETWIRWYDAYGDSKPWPLASYTRNIWNILANGGNGFNLYPINGGTNFDYWNDGGSASSYDFGTLIGEAGDLRNLYYSVRRATLFATSFPDILENSGNSTASYAAYATGPAVTSGNPAKTKPGVEPYARTSPAGTIVFVRNTQNSPATATLATGQTLSLDPLEVAPLLVDATLAPGIRAKVGAVRTLALATHGATTTWIVHGKAGEKAHIELDLDQNGAFAQQGATPDFQVAAADPKHPQIDLTFASDAPQALALTSGGQSLRILAEPTAWTDRTWIAGARGSQSVIIGPDYVGDFSETNGKARMTVGRNYGDAALKDVSIYEAAEAARHIAVTDPAPTDGSGAPVLSAWEAAKADQSAAPGLDDKNWLTASGEPPQLGQDNNPTAYGWYRASFDAPAEGSANLAAQFADHATVFLNGDRVDDVSGKANVALQLKAGRNVLAVFVSHHGREKAYNYVNKPLATYYPKGVLGPVTLTQNGTAIPIADWKLKGGINAIDDAALTWQPAPAGNLGAPAFFRATFTAKNFSGTGTCSIYRLATMGLSRGSVWLNGHNLGRYPEVINIHGPYLPECWLKDGANSLVVFDEEGHVPTADVHLWCETAASRELFNVEE